MKHCPGCKFYKKKKKHFGIKERIKELPVPVFGKKKKKGRKSNLKQKSESKNCPILIFEFFKSKSKEVAGFKILKESEYWFRRMEEHHLRFYSWWLVVVGFLFFLKVTDYWLVDRCLENRKLMNPRNRFDNHGVCFSWLFDNRSSLVYS
jgi:hypothetical protein